MSVEKAQKAGNEDLENYRIVTRIYTVFWTEDTESRTKKENEAIKKEWMQYASFSAAFMFFISLAIATPLIGLYSILLGAIAALLIFGYVNYLGRGLCVAPSN